MNDKQRMLWTMVGMIQAYIKESWTKEQLELIEKMEKDMK